MKRPDHIIPKNRKGASTDTVSSVTLPTRAEALRHFQKCKTRLLSVSRWHEYTGLASAEFKLKDPFGNTKEAPVEKGDYFQINIPAPGTDSGEGYDWVQIESIEEESNLDDDWEYILIKVRPATKPGTADNATAHFFSDETNSYFMIKRKGKEVSAEVHGRNEQPNIDTENLKDKVRNTLIAIGAMLGISKMQWKSLTDGLSSTKEKK